MEVVDFISLGVKAMGSSPIIMWKSEAVISDWYLDSNIHSIAPARH